MGREEIINYFEQFSQMLGSLEKRSREALGVMRSLSRKKAEV